MRKCFYACLIIALCSCNCPLQAQHTLVLKDNKHDNAISPHAYVFTGHASLAAIDTILRSDSAKFVRNNSLQEINYGLGKTNAWCVFFIRNESDQQNWILKIQQSRVDTAQLYVARGENAAERFPLTGHFQTFAKRPVYSLPFAYAITIKKNETLGFYLYTARQYGKHAPILNFQTKEHFESYEYGFNMALSFVSGMVILASFVGFFLFLFVRQRLYIYYSVYALSFFFVLLADSGFAHAVLSFPFDQTVANGFTMIFYYWMGGCLGVFSIELLQLKKYANRWVYWFGIILSYGLCAIALLLLIPGLPHIIRFSFVSASYYLAFITNVYILYIISISVLKKEPIVYFYMAGFFATSLIAIVVLLSDFEIIDFPFQNKDVYFLAPLIEILFVALGIGIHFSRTLKERINVQLALNQTQDQIITIQEDERRRIAQDLHDDVGNSLAAIKNMVIHKRESVSVEKEIDTIIHTVRTISHDLMPVDFNEFSLVDIIGHTVNKFKDHPTLTLEFDHTGNAIKLKSLTELVIYRIINELITNIYKHSQASKAFIQLIYQEDSLVVTVEDNGTGIKKSKIEEGIGMRSIRLRSDYIQAKLKIESDDKGTLIILEVCQYGGASGWGVLFEYDPSTTTWTIKYNFDTPTGSVPQGGLIKASNGKLYGTTSKGGANGSGVLFEYDLATSTFTKLYDFALANGSEPSGTLVQATNGKLYGMCPAGGANNFGVVFEYDLALSQYALKKSFSQSDAFGIRPFGGLTESSNGKLYGLTSYNISLGVNVSRIIELDPANGNVTYKLGAAFSKGAGDYNYSSMISVSNTLYGVSPRGGETGSGVLFSYNPFADDYHTVFDFDYGEEGAFPYAGMTLAGNGKMYGLLSTGGTGKKGLLYEFDPVTNDYMKKVEFAGSNGANPLGEMLLASNGKLYGTTTFGGASSNTNFFSIEDGSFTLREGTGYGVLFEYDPATGAYTKIVEFDASVGTNPFGQLMEASDGFFYGVTNRGGANNGGTIYKFDLGTGQLTKLKDLPANASVLVAGPRSGLTEAPNGKFYGVTPYGDNASTGGGIVYEYNPTSGDFTILKKFSQVNSAVPNEGNVPMGRLTLGADGKLYGMNSQGGEQSFLGGTIFQVDPATGQVTIKKLLDASIGVFPKGSFVADASGKMYAMCNKGSFGQWGTVIQYDPATNSLIRKVEFAPPYADGPDYSTLVLYPGKMDQRIALETFTPKAYGSGTITLPANSSAGLPLTYSSSNPAVATVSGNVVTLVSVGSTDIKAVQSGTDDYNAAPDVTKALTVTKANQTLIFDAFTHHKVSENYLSLYAYVSSFLKPTFTSSDPEVASVTTNANGSALTFHKIGTVTITASQPGNDFYNAATSVERSLTITIGDQNITFPEFTTVRVNATPFTINASVSSGLPLTFTSSNTDVATVSGSQITVLAAGTTNIKAVQAGNTNFNAAAEVTRVLTISKLDQTITFFPLSTRTLGDAPFLLGASATSSLAVQYSTASDKIALAAGQVTMVKAGSVIIAADQPGNNTYGAAPRVEQSFCINPAKPSVTLSEADSENILLTSSAAAGNQWYLDGTAIASATQPTLHPATAGVYTVKVTVDNCSSELSDPMSLIVTGLSKSVESSIKMYPNPVISHLIIELPSDNHSYTLQLFHSDGSRMLESLETTRETAEWDVRGLATGFYIVRVKHLGKTEHHKFVKR